MKILTIKASTTDEEIAAEITHEDMRQEAIERRDDAAAVMDTQGDQEVLELHRIDGVDVLYSPVFGYALINQKKSLGHYERWLRDTLRQESSESSKSLLIGHSECTGPYQAVMAWRIADDAEVREALDVNGDDNITPEHVSAMRELILRDAQAYEWAKLSDIEDVDWIRMKDEVMAQA